METTRIDCIGRTKQDWEMVSGATRKNEATVLRWCSNSSQPSLEMLLKIADVLKIDVRKLINHGNNEERHG